MSPKVIYQVINNTNNMYNPKCIPENIHITIPLKVGYAYWNQYIEEKINKRWYAKKYDVKIYHNTQMVKIGYKEDV